MCSRVLAVGKNELSAESSLTMNQFPQIGNQRVGIQLLVGLAGPARGPIRLALVIEAGPRGVKQVIARRHDSASATYDVIE